MGAKNILILCDLTSWAVSRIVDADGDDDYGSIHYPEPGEVAFLHRRGNRPSPLTLPHVAELHEQYNEFMRSLT